MSITAPTGIETAAHHEVLAGLTGTELLAIGAIGVVTYIAAKKLFESL